jgi:hypothetical protein
MPLELGWITGNPARGVELPKSRPPEKVFLDYDEVERLASIRRSTGSSRHDQIMTTGIRK